VLSLLKGVRVVDFTTVVLGPYATLTLGDLGADVIKVEPLTGDAFRAVRPGHHAELGAGFLNLNRNKRSIAIDLRSPEGLAAVDRLVAEADVVVHNMRPASAERLGIGFERLRTLHPRLVYCYTPGFGSEGRDGDAPAYDDTIQARSGLASLNADASGEPRFLATIVADKVGGLHLAIAVLAALVAREQRGEAVCVEAPMFESLVSFLMIEQLAGRSFVPALGGTGYDRLRSPHRKPYRTRDGYLAILPYTTLHWVRFLELIGAHDLAQDPRVTDPVARSRSVDMLYAVIADVTPTRSTAEWLELLGARDIPCAPVNSLEALFDDPHLADVGMFREADHPSEGRLVSVRTPFRSGDETGDRPPPRLGADTAELLREIGYDLADVAALTAAGVVREALA
jgi:crotonobetainyl-CoA:carnitine CoA-transferase CaiB-like acyl-CoA transferase